MNSQEGRQPDSKIGVCHYHLCRKRTKVYRCPFCGEYFCTGHLEPRPPGLPNFESTKRENKLFMEEWRKPGHPCVPYFEFWEAEQKRKEERYARALDALIKSKPLKESFMSKVKRFLRKLFRATKRL